ncbi:TPA: molecular chaperone [Escherichia coli]|nr:molecular chaperone [Escherichia coli]
MAVSINSQGEGNVRVISKSNEVQYIKATVFRIDNPSTPQEQEVEIKSGDATHLGKVRISRSFLPKLTR